jgi:16S rRNA (uracil1498-N3)-methyltransferase
LHIRALRRTKHHHGRGLRDRCRGRSWAQCVAVHDRATMPPRLFIATAITAGAPLALGEAASRHAQVLRLQPGAEVVLFDGRGGQWGARIDTVTRREVTATALAYDAVERELALSVTLALAMPAGERMDTVVEKATELGAAQIVPLHAERSVLRLSGERALKRQAHWQAIAVAACEQCGRNRVPTVHAPQPLTAWLASLEAAPAPGQARWLLGWRDAQPWAAAAAPARAVTLLSGPEGGFTADEEALAHARGFAVVGLGPRVLRADTAPLAALAALSLAAA